MRSFDSPSGVLRPLRRFGEGCRDAASPARPPSTPTTTDHHRPGTAEPLIRGVAPDHHDAAAPVRGDGEQGRAEVGER